MKRIRICILFFFVLLFFSACSRQESSSGQEDSTQQPAENAAPLVLIHGDSSNRYVLGYSGELTVEELLEGVSQLIGVDLSAGETERSEGTVKIDFLSDPFSAEKKEDVEAIVEFTSDAGYAACLLDSIAATMRENFGKEIQVYFSYKGQALSIPSLNLSLPADSPYEGSSLWQGTPITEEEATEKLQVLLSQEHGELAFAFNSQGQQLISGKNCLVYTAVYETAEFGTYGVTADGTEIYRYEPASSQYVLIQSQAMDTAKTVLERYVQSLYPDASLSVLPSGEISVEGETCYYFLVQQLPSEKESLTESLIEEAVPLGYYAVSSDSSRLYQYQEEEEAFEEILPGEVAYVYS
mgnify:CR=1